MMMNLADPELELIDPTPNVCSMFLHFDRTFFWSQLASRCVVRWSKRMYSCAGTCSYEGRGGLCYISLSEPLLKLRPRKDLVETLLHEMIHAFLFVTNRDQDRDGHGPNFQAHMHRINRAAGINISIYHDFHDEVKLYQTHWWRCNGPCQSHKPYFGIVRRSCNRTPGPSDYWWYNHLKYCGGTFIKIKEPEKPAKKGKKTNVTKPNADITKYINNNNNKDATNKNIIQDDKPTKSVLNDTSNIISPIQGINTNRSTLVTPTKATVKIRVVISPKVPVVFNGTGHTIGSKHPDNVQRERTKSNDVFESVRNVWANKQISTNSTTQVLKVNNSAISNPYKHKSDYPTESPPAKIKKIDDYFKTSATSVLKDIYGQDFNITHSKDDQKLKVIPANNINFVGCPVCNTIIDSGEINRHLDECLNKDIIDKLSKENTPAIETRSNVIVIKDDGTTVPEQRKSLPILKEKVPNISKNVINKPAANNHITDPGIVIEKKTRSNVIVIKEDGTTVPENKRKSLPILKDIVPNTSNNVINKPAANNHVTDPGIVIEKKTRSNVIVIKEDGTTVPENKRKSIPILNKVPNTLNKVINKPAANNHVTDPGIVIDLDCQNLRKSFDQVNISDENNVKGSTTLNQKTMKETSPISVNPPDQLEPSCSHYDITKETTCPCCGDKLNKTVDEHLDECLSFFENNTTIPHEGTIIIDDDFDDEFDESQTLNKTGTKLPCPCCLKMIEFADMSQHLVDCLVSSN